MLVFVGVKYLSKQTSYTDVPPVYDNETPILISPDVHQKQDSLSS